MLVLFDSNSYKRFDFAVLFDSNLQEIRMSVCFSSNPLKMLLSFDMNFEKVCCLVTLLLA